MYTIRVTCSYDELYRYNTVVMCGGYDSAQEELYVVSARDEASQGGEFALPQITTLTADRAENLRIVVYLVAHTLPENLNVEELNPFEVDIKVTKGGKEIYHKPHEVNPWGGAAIEIKL